MKKEIIHLLFLGLLIVFANLFSAFEILKQPVTTVNLTIASDPEPGLKGVAFEVLKAKCNVCHKKQNPFKVFSLKNMDKHAPKIYKQVFVYKRMPKGNQTKLTDKEYQALKNWLKSKNIF